jgi:dihydrofolate reductase
MTRLSDAVIVLAMSEDRRIEGYAIVSTEGMIANAGGVMPDAIRNSADQRFLQSELDRAAVVVHGRHSDEGGPRAARRKRLILTRHVASLSSDPTRPNALLWNPAGATLDAALAKLSVANGLVAILGGTQVFDLFLPLYDAFHLTRAAHAKIPNGRPVFSQVSPHRTPEDVLAGAGLKPGHRQDLDAAAGMSLTTWKRGEADAAAS